MYIKKGLRNKFLIALILIGLGVAGFVFYNGGIESTLSILNITKHYDTNKDPGNKDNVAVVFLEVKQKDNGKVGDVYNLEYYINSSMTEEKWNNLLSQAEFRNGANKNDAIKAMKGFTKTNKEYYESILKNKKYKYKKELKVLGY